MGKVLGAVGGTNPLGIFKGGAGKKIGGFFDTISGNKDRRKQIEAAAAEAQFQPFNVQMGGATANVGPDGATVTGGAGSSLIPGFESAAQQSLDAGTNLGLTPQQAMQMAQAQDPTAQGFTAAGNAMLQRLQGFDPDAFASQQFERLNRLAAPGEETAASSTANALFSRGRLGGNDSVSGRAFGDLDLSQRMARDSRLLQSIGLAGQESDRLANFATQFGGAGNQFQNDAVQRFMASLGAGTGTAGFNLNQATTAAGGINTALTPQQQALHAALSGSALGTEANLGRARIMTGFNPTEGANAAGSFGGGLIGGIFGSDIRLKTDIRRIGRDDKGRNLYSWKWSGAAKAIGWDTYPTEGYLAQELQHTDPQAIIEGPDGYLMVNTEAL
jgi:hypothetical protein